VKRFKLPITFLLFLFALDGILFRYLLWEIPNETAFDTEPHYNYLYRERKLARNKPDEEFRVIVSGSSLAIYSILEKRLEALLNRSLHDRLPAGKTVVRVYLLAHQGQNTMNLLSALDPFQEVKADLVIHPVNMVDFRLERPIVLGNIDALSRKEGEKRSEAVRRFSRAVLDSPEFRIIAPRGVLRHFHDSLTANETGSMIASFLLSSYRFKQIFQTPIRLFFANHFGKGHSYLHYAGIPIDGINWRGYTSPRFRLHWNAVLERTGLELEAPVQLFQSESEPPHLVYRKGGCDAKEAGRIDLKKGWQTVRFSGVRVGELLCVTVDPSFEAEQFAERIAVRIGRNAGVDLFSGKAFFREKRREDDLYLHYSAEEYRRSFEKRVLRFDRAGMAYLAALKRAKEEWAKRRFDPGLPVMQAFAEWRRGVSGCSPIVVVHSPENPISREWYSRSKWYEDFVRFLSCKDERCAFHDAASLLKENYFYDYHHLSYYGAEKFTDRVAEWVEQLPESFTEGRSCAPGR